MINVFEYKYRNGYYCHITSKVHTNTMIGSNTIIERNCLIGKVHRNNIRSILIDNRDNQNNIETIVGCNCHIEENTILCEGVVLGDNVQCGSNIFIGLASRIGQNSKLHYRAQIFKRVEIGENCRIGGFICNDATIGNNCSIYGTLVHKYALHNGTEKDRSKQGTPSVGNDVILGFNSMIIGGVKVSNNVYIAAGAIVSKDIPPNSMVKNTNEISPWKI